MCWTGPWLHSTRLPQFTPPSESRASPHRCGRVAGLRGERGRREPLSLSSQLSWPGQARRAGQWLPQEAQGISGTCRLSLESDENPRRVVWSDQSVFRLRATWMMTTMQAKRWPYSFLNSFITCSLGRERQGSERASRLPSITQQP